MTEQHATCLDSIRPPKTGDDIALSGVVVVAYHHQPNLTRSSHECFAIILSPESLPYTDLGIASGLSHRNERLGLGDT